MLLPFPLLYAEVHFRLPFLFNLLFQKEPEIVADAPYRVTKNNMLPVLILIKDAHRFPIFLQSISIFIDARKVLVQDLNTKVKDKWKEWIFEVNIQDFSIGWHEISVKINYRVKNKNKVCFIDNYPSLNHEPLQCYFAEKPLPLKTHFYAGDFHSHSNFTEDQIEFGASLATMKRMAKAIELDFFAVTDHSYDLDDALNNYLTNDPDFPKWKAFLKQVNDLNSQNPHPLIIAGEEISVRNRKKQTVHLLALNNANFIVGSGDSGERWFKHISEFSVKEALQQLPDNGISLPAHPAQHVPLAQRLFINRGPWSLKDLTQNPFTGIQFINGGQQQAIDKAISLWVSLLLKGHRLLPAAGNDAHGHFNRTREIAIPFVNLREHHQHIFGYWRTVIYCPQKPLQVTHLLNCYKSGRLFLTNGPFIEITGYRNGHPIFMGQETPALKSIKLEIIATKETGCIEHIELLAGDGQQQKEYVIWSKTFQQEAIFCFSEKISLTLTPSSVYIRAQVKTETGFALTNVIWIKPK